MAAPAARTTERQRLGLLGEDIAERHLKSLGFEILARRWRPPGAHASDIDIIARDGGELVFVEVKSRCGSGYGWPEDSVTRAKRRHILRAAFAWLDRHARPGADFRIDVIAMMVDTVSRRASVRHFKGAVGED
jgi:putative endonuclease